MKAALHGDACRCVFLLAAMAPATATPSVVLATAGYDHTVRFWEVCIPPALPWPSLAPF